MPVRPQPSSSADADFIARLRASFHAHADAQRAVPMQAYMKSAMPFLGIGTPLRRELAKAVVRAQPLADAATLAATMLELWRSATFREERYAASELARVGPHAALQGLELLPVYEEMTCSGAWWDHGDEISGNGLATLLRLHPQTMKPVLRRWARGDDLWLRRAAMLCQRNLKDERSGFDAVLFYDCLLPSLGDPRFEREFFIRKAMGWALRQRAYTAPDEVRAFCSEYAAQLSPLTRREALRVMDARGAKRRA